MTLRSFIPTMFVVIMVITYLLIHNMDEDDE
jgi:hypothetical protein